MNTIRTKAIVVHRTNYGEADRIMSLITPEHGKLSVIARGVRKEKSKLAGGIELMAVTELTLHKGKGNLMIVTSARLDTYFSHIVEDFDRLQFAYYVLKDISKAAEMLPEPEFYDITEIVFRSLNDTAIPLSVVALWYRMQMAILLGVGVNLSTDREGNKLTIVDTYRYVPSESVFVTDPRGIFTADHIKLLRLASAQAPQIIVKVSNLAQLIDVCQRVAIAAHE